MRKGEPKLSEPSPRSDRVISVGRPARTSRADIVVAVLEIGIDRATISAVAERLGVDPSTLYGHVHGRDDMLAAAAEAAIARATWPVEAEGDWRTFLSAIADALWGLYRENPGLAAHLRNMQSAPPTLMARSTQVVQTLRTRFGLSLEQAALVTDAIGDSVTDSSLLVTQLDEPHPKDPARLQREDAQAAIAASTSADYARVLRDALGSPGHPSDWWRRKVDLILDGLAYRIQTGEAYTGEPAVE